MLALRGVRAICDPGTSGNSILEKQATPLTVRTIRGGQTLGLASLNKWGRNSGKTTSSPSFLRLRACPAPLKNKKEPIHTQLMPGDVDVLRLKS
jgi:hypothetical protein